MEQIRLYSDSSAESSDEESTAEELSPIDEVIHLETSEEQDGDTNISDGALPEHNHRKRRLKFEIKSLLTNTDDQCHQSHQSGVGVSQQAATATPRAKRLMKPRQLYNDTGIWISSAISCSKCCAHRGKDRICWNCGDESNYASSLETSVCEPCTPEPKVSNVVHDLKLPSTEGVSKLSSTTKNRPRITAANTESQPSTLSRSDIADILKSSTPTECEACLQFYPPRNIQEHRKKGHDLELHEHACPYCSKRLKSAESRLLHIERIHPKSRATSSKSHKSNIRVYIYDCPGCETSRSFVDLRKHMKNQHELAIKDFEDSLTCTCPFCLTGSKPVRITFRTMERFLHHINDDHPGCRLLGKKFPLVDDGKDMALLSQSKKGVMTSTRQKHHDLPLVTPKSTHINQHPKHQEKHNDASETISRSEDTSPSFAKMLQSSAPAECEVCFKITADSSLSKHRNQVHNLTKNEFQCRYCLKRLTSEERRLQHIEKLHPTLPAFVNPVEKSKFRMYLYDCPKCDTTLSFVDLSDHMKKAHELSILDYEDSLSCTCPFCLLVLNPVRRSFRNMDEFLSHLRVDHPGCSMLGKQVRASGSGSSKRKASSGDGNIIRQESVRPEFSPRGVEDVRINFGRAHDTVLDSVIDSAFDCSITHEMSSIDVDRRVIQIGLPRSCRDLFESYVYPKIKNMKDRNSLDWIIENCIHESICDGYSFNDENALPLNLLCSESDESLQRILNNMDRLIEFVSTVLIESFQQSKTRVEIDNRFLFNLSNNNPQIPKSLKEATVENIIDRISCIFKCSICLGIMTDIHVIPRCFHRICYTCSVESFRKCSSRCAECKTSVTSKRELRKDNCFDNLKNLIFGKDGLVNFLENNDENLKGSIRRCFECSLCNNATEETYVVPECLHRLCTQCTVGRHKSCPKCSQISNFPIRRDVRFDELRELLICKDGLFDKLSEPKSA